MANFISQDTFDDVVKENIVEFLMSPDEAKEETIKQFEAQGINLANIIKDLAINEESGTPLLNGAIDKLKAHIGEKTASKPEILQYLTVLDEECSKSLPHRVLAGKNGAHEALVTLLEQELAETKPDVQVIEKCLRAVNSLTNKQPDIFDAEALAIILQLLELTEGDISYLTLQWLQKACIMHEMNRQNIMNAGILKILKPYVSKSTTNVIREVMALFRYLVLDDDVRVEFGCAHEHARLIANELIVELTGLLSVFDEVNILADLILTIATLAVRQEFCKSIDDAGGVKTVFELMKRNTSDVRLIRESLKLLRALAGNDTVKVAIVQEGAAPVITEVLRTYLSNENVVAAALACISTLTLRVKVNSAAFFEAGAAEVIVEVLRIHCKNKNVQRNGAWAIRNMVSRSREQCGTWLSCGVEDLLNEAMTEHPSVQQDIKAALRDLGCKVDLREEWTGTAEKKITNN